MKNEHSISEIKKGDTMVSVQEKLGLASPPGRLPDPDKLIYFYHLPEWGYWIFFDENGIAYSIRFEHPFPHAIEGVHIGDTKKQVLETLGTPTRYLPVPDSRNRWIYEQPQRLRFDFNNDTGQVEKIFRL